MANQTQNLDRKPEILTSGFICLESRSGKQLREVDQFLTIGRDPSNGLALSDAFVSARHARVERRDQGFVVRDLRSRNGTSLNGLPVLEARLSDGDRLKVGETELLFTSTRELKCHALTSQNARWQEELKKLPSIAQSELEVLINGPSGAGKEVIAQHLHQFSGRRQGPLVSVNCSALSESLIESELFGHLRGSFTGASHDRQGAFEYARGGTLFLDEIGDLPLSLQPKLLRAIENREIRPVGSDRTLRTDARILTATHHDLRKLVRLGRFREDLFFRLAVVRIQVPALMSRMEDFEDLLNAFAKQFRVGFTYPAIQRLKEHPWPGNIRELRNLVARAKAYFPNRKIEPQDLQDLIENSLPEATASGEGGSGRPILKELECEMIQERLVANLGNQRRTAQDLGMPKSTLHDRLQTYGINIKSLLAGRGIYLD